MCVDPQARGQGIGSRLLNFALKEAEARGAQRIKLYTSHLPQEHEAHAMYEKFGLKICEEYLSSAGIKMITREKIISEHK